jgi:hypothetical protein
LPWYQLWRGNPRIAARSDPPGHVAYHQSDVGRSDHLTRDHDRPILAGLDPVEAVKYQVLLMFLLAGSSLLADAAVAFLAHRRLKDGRNRLCLDQVSRM